MIYIVCEICEDNKKYAYAETIRTGEDVFSILKTKKNLTITKLCGSRAEAERTALHWNACYKVHGTYLFDTPNFLKG